MFETILCPVCGENKTRVLRKAKYPPGVGEADLQSHFSASSNHGLWDQLAQCLHCEMVYTNPRISADLVSAGYQSAVDPVFVAQNPYRIQTFKRSLKTICSKIGLKPNKQSILDIGCAGGAFLKAATDFGFDPIGIEPSRWLCDYGKSTYHVDARPGFLSDYTFENGYFEWVTLWDVLEHIPNPSQLLDEVFRLLKPGGYCVLTFPDFGSLARRMLGEKWPFLLNVHLLYYTQKTLSRHLAQAGFKVLFTKPHWQDLQLNYVIERASDYIPLLKKINPLLNALRIGSLPMRYTVGQSLLVAQKNT